MEFTLSRRPDISPTAIAWNDIAGFLLPQEIGILYKVGLNAPKDAVFLEIGSFFGLSSALIAKGFKDAGNENARLHCFDLWENYYGASREKFEENLEKAEVLSWIVVHQESSRNVAQHFEPKSLDLVFIDGDHSYEGCLADLNDVAPLVKPGGRIIGHDFASYSVPVMNAVRDFLHKTPGVMFDAPESGSSIFSVVMT